MKQFRYKSACLECLKVIEMKHLKSLVSHCVTLQNLWKIEHFILNKLALICHFDVSSQNIFSGGTAVILVDVGRGMERAWVSVIKSQSKQPCFQCVS